MHHCSVIAVVPFSFKLNSLFWCILLLQRSSFYPEGKHQTKRQYQLHKRPPNSIMVFFFFCLCLFLPLLLSNLLENITVPSWVKKKKGNFSVLESCIYMITLRSYIHTVKGELAVVYLSKRFKFSWVWIKDLPVAKSKNLQVQQISSYCYCKSVTSFFSNCSRRIFECQLPQTNILRTQPQRNQDHACVHLCECVHMWFALALALPDLTDW